ncbi:hypothetical protein [Streptomyces sp. NPDC058268]|uniref:hypothetical protein n=1 Tax=Streptomyces sp. NPDC058268 TaxID=3346413 RepID=UPI0036E9A583
MTINTPAEPDLLGEDQLIDVIRQHAQVAEHAFTAATAGWVFRTQFHLLLALGRRFTAVPHPGDLVGMPDRLCYSNAAHYALANPDDQLLYAEGFAITHTGMDFHLPHAWCVRPDGTVVDPTWDDVPGRAYIGVPVADAALWPVGGGGLLSDVDRCLPLLRDGFAPGAVADVGRPLS